MIYNKLNMKYLFICAYLILPYFALAQNGSNKVRYDIEVVSQDSFFLSEKNITGAKVRPDTLIVYTLFRDTAEFIAYVKEKIDEAETARLQAEYFKAEYDSLFDRVKRLRQLAKKVLGVSDSNKNNRSFEVEPAKPGFWVIYPPTAQAEYIHDISEIKQDAIILNQNGASMLFELPKIKIEKKTRKKKAKKQ